MLCFLIALSFAFLIFFYLINGKELISPTLLVVGEYNATLLFAVFARSHYGIDDISFKMVVVVLLSFVFLGFGDFMAKTLYAKKNDMLTDSREKKYKEYDIRKTVILVFFVFNLFVAYWALRDLFSFANRNGIGGDFITTFSRVRSLTAKGIITYSPSTALSQVKTISVSFSYICIYLFLYELIFRNKMKLLFLLPVIGEMLVLVSTTGRVAYIRLFSVFITILIIFLKTKTNWTGKYNGIILRLIIGSVIVFLVLFRILGYLTNKSFESNSLDNFYAYIAAGIFGYDDYLRFPEANHSVFGHHAFYNLYVILNLFGFNIPLGSQFNEPRFIGREYIGSVMGTGLLVPTQDFGVIGMLITRFMIGFFYQWGLMRLKSNPNCINRPIQMIFCGIFMYPIVMSSLDDSFRTLLSLGYIYMAIYLYLFIRLFVEKQDSLPLDSDDYSAAIATKSIGRQETVS